MMLLLMLFMLLCMLYMMLILYMIPVPSILVAGRYTAQSYLVAGGYKHKTRGAAASKHGFFAV